MTEVHNIQLTIGAETKRSRFKPLPVVVDWNALPDASQAFIIAYGLKQYLADGQAGAETEAEAHGGVKGRIEKLLSGDLSRTKGEAKAKPDTVEGRAIKLAVAAIRGLLKEANQTATKEQISEAAVELVKTDDSFTKEAKRQIDTENKMKVSDDSNPLAAIMARFKAAGFYVMSGGTSRERAFDSNATGFKTEAEAQVEADRRNQVERDAGRNEDEVLWFVADGNAMAEAVAK